MSITVEWEYGVCNKVCICCRPQLRNKKNTYARVEQNVVGKSVSDVVYDETGH